MGVFPQLTKGVVGRSTQKLFGFSVLKSGMSVHVFDRY